MQSTIIYAVLLVLLEALYISFLADASTFQAGSLSWLISHMGSVLKWLITAGSTYCLLLYLYKKPIPAPRLVQSPQLIIGLLLHLVCYASLIFLTLIIFNQTNHIPTVNEGSPKTPPWYIFLWLTLLTLTLASWVYSFFSARQFIQFIKDNIYLLMSAALISFVIFIIYYFSSSLWKPLSFITLHGSAFILSIAFNNVYIDIPEKLLGINDFVVNIAPECSGLEGVIVVTIVTLTYIVISRKVLKFPLSLLLIPIAILLAIICNIFRIVILLVLGDLISPELAINGFHSVAGWIMAALVTSLIIFVFSNCGIFYNSSTKVINQDQPQKSDGELATAILIPFVGLLLFSLSSSLFPEDSVFLYPARTLLSGLLVAYFWKRYQLTLPKKWIEPIAVGLLITIIWVLLDNNTASESYFFSINTESLALYSVILWSLFRIIGFCFITPIIEELVFRTYILTRLSSHPLKNTQKIALYVPALIGNALIFGLIHEAYIAGFIAGLLLTLVRYRSRSIAEPILAHGSANIFLCFV